MQEEEEQKKDLIDFKLYIRILRKFWYVVALILLASYLIAYYKIRYATPIYMVKTTMQIKDKSSYSSGSQNFLEGASMFQPFKNLKNEMELLKSYNRIRMVLQELDFMWEYRVKGSIRDIELYHNCPFYIQTDSSFIVTNVPFFISIIDKNSFYLSVNAARQRVYDPVSNAYVDTIVSFPAINKGKFHFGQTISWGGLCTFKIVKDHSYNNSSDGLEYTMIARDLHSLTKEYKNKIGVAETEKSSIIKISCTGSIIAKEVAFLRKVSEVYVRKELEDKNQIANNTIGFIDSQLKIIADSLTEAENTIQNFRQKNKIYDFEEQSGSILTQFNDLEGRKLEAELKNGYYEYLRNYLNQDKDVTALVAPSIINIDDPELSTLIEDLITLYQQKNTLKYASSEKTPAYQTLMIRIRTTKEALLETTNNLVNTSKSAIAELDRRIAIMEKQMTSIPKIQRNLINIERKHIINDNIYNYLLEKRAEASIARAANLPDAFIVESPLEDEYVQIAPIVNKIYTTNMLSGIGLIVLLVVVYGKIDNKVHTKEDIIKLTDVSLIGTVGFSTSDGSQLVHAGQGTLTESFRSIRTNLQFLLQGKKTFVIGITSCISGDGKSFCSLNLARVYAISGKKTLLIRGDMRKVFNNIASQMPANAKGLSQMLIGAASMEEIVLKSDIDNLYQITPGPIPPNASELVASNKMEEFILQVKGKFDVVIVDSPPVGIVSDYLSILKHMDVNLYIVRYDHTPKETLEAIKDLKIKYPVASHSIIFNGITANLLRKYSYYGNQIEYGYEPEKQKRWWEFFSR